MITLLKKFSESIGFTPTERRVVIFLVSTFVLGIGIKVFREHFAASTTYDYSKTDEEFAQHLQDDQRNEMALQDTVLQSRDTVSTVTQVKVGKKDVAPGSININIAGKEALMKLPGIGVATAERILRYRQEKGRFTTIDELMNVKGIGKKKFERLAPFCTTGK